jgi:hypothetical protein
LRRIPDQEFSIKTGPSLGKRGVSVGLSQKFLAVPVSPSFAQL